MLSATLDENALWKKSLIEIYLAGVSVRQFEDIKSTSGYEVSPGTATLTRRHMSISKLGVIDP